MLFSNQRFVNVFVLVKSTQNGNNCLHYVILGKRKGRDGWKNQKACLAFLIERNPRMLAMTNKRNRTPFDLAAEQGDEVLVDEIHALGKDVRLTSRHSTSPMQIKILREEARKEVL